MERPTSRRPALQIDISLQGRVSQAVKAVRALLTEDDELLDRQLWRPSRLPPHDVGGAGSMWCPLSWIRGFGGEAMLVRISRGWEITPEASPSLMVDSDNWRGIVHRTPA